MSRQGAQTLRRRLDALEVADDGCEDCQVCRGAVLIVDAADQGAELAGCAYPARCRAVAITEEVVGPGASPDQAADQGEGTSHGR